MNEEQHRLLNLLNQGGKTLWLADENAKDLVSLLTPSDERLILTNRYDIYLEGKDNHHNIYFNDFDFSVIKQTIERVICRTPKEKLLFQHMAITSSGLGTSIELITIGQKNEGIKGHHKWLTEDLGYLGQLKKHKNDYIGRYQTRLTTLNSNYQDLTKVETHQIRVPYFYSKPGVFGWQKIDKGSELLIEQVLQHFQTQAAPGALADIGCGYGWLLLNLRELHCDYYLGTDNNAAAIQSAQKNMNDFSMNAEIIATDCVQGIDKKVDCVVCNPPFHQGFTHDTNQTQRFVQGAAKILKPGGIAFFVVNQFVGIEPLLNQYFIQHKELNKAEGFRVFFATK